MKLSIIIPVYNVETYLQKCVNSLLSQDIPKTDYEIILVDDGSTDKSGELCDYLAANNGNICVIHQQNRGPSAARNTGIAAATGKYIQFVDSDDYLCPNVLGGIIYQLENQRLDILRINYQNVNSDGEVFEPNKYSKPFDDYSEEVCDGVSFLNGRLGFACYAVQFITHASLLHHGCNNFKEGIYYEEVDWAPRILIQAKRVASSQTMVYNYFHRQNSITRNSDIDRKRKSIEDKLLLIETLKDLKNIIKRSPWFDGMIAQIVLSILSEVSHFFYNNKKHYIRCLKELQVFPLSSYHATASASKKIWLANLSPNLLCVVNRFTQDRHK